MGIIQRFKDIMEANINALLDRAEDPSKMIDQYMRNLQKDLEEVKAETASVMAEEKRARRALDQCNEEIGRLQMYAEKGVAAGNDQDAKQFLVQKKALGEKQKALQTAYDMASENSRKMKAMHDKLVMDMGTLEARKEAVKAKVAVAKTQQKINQIGESINGAAHDMNAFARMEAQADKMLDEAQARAELNEYAQSTRLDDLKLKYDLSSMSDVDDELAELKAQMGVGQTATEGDEE